ncbi:hypothetical protein ABW43_07460 [Stenotrophomonas maltophilia]|nr:hypothetical protein ABW43_07460 [Stenotrophomonas maltophilia]
MGLLQRTICAMEMNYSESSARDGVVRLIRECGMPFVLRRIDGEVKAFPLTLPNLGPVPEGGGQVLWMWGGVDGDA